ncbi:MAG: ABC-F family ATP-binding cassette domain-containing protein [Deltaproteobacteria bacterium]|nr:ABC-F family ATP-binding cassette domain-containing protein [Deltaproteobacteria bacterium]
MTLLRAADVSLSFGSRTVFDGLTLTVEEGERVGLVGVNGSGKSSLMQILAGAQLPDRGELQLQRGKVVTYLPQEPEFPPGASIASELTVAQAPLQRALAEHAELAEKLADPSGSDERVLKRMAELNDFIERHGGWDTSHRARALLDRLGVKDWDRSVSELSGGNKKRVAIARALLQQPDLLLLDEPTNHLDADTVEWLEEALDAQEGALVLVTHDRYFLDDLVERIVEIQPGKGLVSYPGNYEMYLEQKLEAEENASVAQHKRERWIAQEVAWLRKGVEARRTKSKARIERAQKLLAEKGFKRPEVAALQAVAAPRLSATVIEAEHVSQGYGAREVLRDVSVQIQGGERLGIVGPNGAGKTTLLRTLIGEMPARSGAVKLGPKTKIAYYDQQRAQLDPELTVYEAASNEDYVDLGGKRMALRDYLDDLLFPVPMQRMQVKALSGGERNRLLLAKLLLQGANVLCLDEPTNDLDIVTLNVLERLLLQFSGAILLVTHDRYFLDKVATGILAVEGDGHVTRFPGNYSMYRTLKAQAAKPAPAPVAAPVAEKAEPKSAPKKKLGYLEQRELDGMEAAIEKAESAKSALEAQLGDGSLWASDPKKAAQLQAELDAAAKNVDQLYVRWQELQDKQS